MRSEYNSLTDQKKHGIIICGPSGVGKGTLIKEVLARYPDHIGYSVSHTSRKPRLNEVDGKSYYFTTREDMDMMLRNGLFIEACCVHGDFYGTSKHALFDVISKKCAVILEVDIQGAQKIKEELSEDLQLSFFFIAPPDLEVLKTRMMDRNSEGENDICKRIETAKKELTFLKENLGFFSHIIINNNIQEAANILANQIAEIINCVP